jgi:CDP-paratose 2-epimerase
MKKIVVTGACGFIGTCLTRKLLGLGYEVIGIDNLSRSGSEINCLELSKFKSFHLYRVDLSNTLKVYDFFSKIGRIDGLFHLAAQVAVTTSYQNREHDFLDNAVASFNVIESVKRYTPDAYCLYASTNKVYGYIDVSKPVGNDCPLNPYTPYGVSKAVGDLYFSEYGRKELGLTTCVLRQSCIYGHDQFGVEDQGWVAWFAISNILGLPLTIYGDGNQRRDLLFIDDLINLYLELYERRYSGIHPVGGGPSNAISLKEGMELITLLSKKEYCEITYKDTRPGDQPYFVADISWTSDNGVNWGPCVDVRTGISLMIDWIVANKKQIRQVLKLQ